MSKFDELSKKFIELSKEVGIQITVDDLKKYIEKNYSDNENNKMSDVELEMVAGGKSANDVRDDMEPVVNTLDWIKKIHVHCFTVDSKISTPNGDKVISEIKIGEEVFSLDAQNKKIIGKVTKIRPIVDEEIYKVEFSNGKIWFTTATQWFYYGNDDYACAIDSQGKSAITEDGTTVSVAKVTKTGEVKKVYDFIIDGLNIFFVEGSATEGYSFD